MSGFRMNTRSVIRDLGDEDTTHANDNPRERTKTNTPIPIDKKRGKSPVENKTDEGEELVRRFATKTSTPVTSEKKRRKSTTESETDEEEELLRQSEALDKALRMKRTKEAELEPSIENEMDDEEELLSQSAALDKALRIKRTKEHIEQTKRYLAEPPSHQVHVNNTSWASSTVTPTLMAPQHFVSRTQLEVPKYDGESFAKLKAFLMDMEINFHLSGTLEHMKVGYACSGLQGGVKERWIKYAGEGGRAKFYDMTWKDFVKWLHNQATDENTRCLNAAKALTRMRQKEGQSFRKYYDKWAAEESEYPDEFPEKLSISMFLNSLQPELRKLIVSKQFPKDWNSLLGQGMSAENANGFEEKHKPAEQSRTKRQRSESRSRSRSPRVKKERSNFEQSPITCFKCGGKGHISTKCWEPDCETCGNPRHTTGMHNGGSKATANTPNGGSRDTANANATPISTVRR
ncbi:hypothetical protein E4U23_000152 [Claviceps purpurea]|nr:hypothetical protein E4U27_008079 [Claviceps purpurea]KAG6236896.1 hypothetical protein E4U23_000152 [Claviceps purpurea]